MNIAAVMFVDHREFEALAATRKLCLDNRTMLVGIGNRVLLTNRDTKATQHAIIAGRELIDIGRFSYTCVPVPAKETE